MNGPRPVGRSVFVGAAVATGIVALLAGALWASETARLRGGPSPALADRVPGTTRSRTGDHPPACRSPLTSDAPLRLWIGGDSLAGSLGPSLGSQTASTGVVQPTYDSRVSSGLSDPSFFDWPREAAAEMARVDPEAVVFIIGANDWNTPRPTPTDAQGQPAWRATYALQVEQILDILEHSNGAAAPRTTPRPVYWVGAPTMQDSRKNAGVKEVNAVARVVVAKHPNATYVDAFDLFSSPSGGYSATLTVPGSKSVRVRTDDGVHFTPEGGDLLGVKVSAPLDIRCHLDAQAVVGHTKPVLVTKGSTQVPGTGRTPTRSASTTPTSAAPVTSPPVTIAPAPTEAPTVLPTPSS